MSDTSEQTIVFLSHADSDLSMLMSAVRELPEGFPEVSGYCLQNADLTALADKVAGTSLAVIRCLGDSTKIIGFADLIERLNASGTKIVALSGTGEPLPDLVSVSTVSPSLVQDAMAYFQAGGAANMAQLLLCLCDRVFLTSYGYELPVQLPEHGIYHPELPANATLADWQKLRRHNACVGLVFYRAHWISGNLDFIDAIVHECNSRGLDVLPVFTSSLRAVGQTQGSKKMAMALEFFFEADKPFIDVLINTTAFAMGEINPGAATMAGWSVAALKRLDVPVLQAVTSSMTRIDWLSSLRGLNALDAAMNVILPEFDGRIMAVPISFKERLQSDEIEVNGYVVVADRIKRLAGLTARFARLRHLPNQQKKIVFVLTNSSGKAAQIGNAVGLDSPASLMAVFAAMKERGYELDSLPDNSDQLIHNLIDRCSYDQSYLTSAQVATALGRVPIATYRQWFAELSEDLQQRMVAQWGSPEQDIYFVDGSFIIAGLNLGNAILTLQPPRGYGVDQNAIYHQPDLPPTHHYFAFYRWLSETFAADAIVHMGKHGTLEWLPGKSVGLSASCFPDALLGDLPLFYPFILNDPGEGAQAKRRAHAVIVDHLMPPMTSADTYGPLAELVQVVDEYYRAEVMDPAKLPLLQEQIWQLVEKANLRYDLASFVDAELAEHEELLQSRNGEQPQDKEPQDGVRVQTSKYTDQVVPGALASMDWLAVSHLIQEIDGYLCELGAAQIRDGLHILGRVPEGEHLVSTLSSLTRLPNVGVPGLQESLAKLFDLNLGTLVQSPGERLVQCKLLESAAARPLYTNADAIETLDSLALIILRALELEQFDSTKIEAVLETSLQTILAEIKSGFLPAAGQLAPLKLLNEVLSFVCDWLVPALRQTSDEIENLMRALAGRYVPAGPSGAPTRGMAHILPTGRNFYAIDPNTLPSQAAWQVGCGLADQVVARYFKETGRYPETISISAWGTSAMRTHGDDIAEVLALIGVRPVWHAENRRVSGVEVIPLNELGRPRIDVTTRISGFFRDAFPNVIDLLDSATTLVIALDEPLEQNFIRKHYLCEVEEHLQGGVARADAERLARYRVFGSKPGTYGAGILPLIQEKNWTSHEHFAQAYVNWGGYAYAKGDYGSDARPQFLQRLALTEVAVQNQDNREHDIFDSDDYMQFHGGMIATIRSATGKQPKRYFGDSQNPAAPKVRDLNEEVLRVFRSRVVNPKWIESIKRHGYKGAVELAATVDYMFGYDATAKVMQDWMYEEVAARYLFDADMRKFLADSNPWAMQAMSERLMEAASRQMWQAKSETLEALQKLYLENDALLEGRDRDSAILGMRENESRLSV
jgi:cobaltochelatase CobN